MINNIKWVFGIYSKEDLDVMQSWDLQRKIQVTTTRIIEWYEYFGGNVYVAFSGGKDSTVLLDIVRRIYPDVPAVFCDTGLEFPEIREFVKQHDNVVILRPEMNFRKVIETYGYPVVSKRVADTVEYGSKPGSYRWKELHGEIIRSNGTPSEFNCEENLYDAMPYLFDDMSVGSFFSGIGAFEKALTRLENHHSESDGDAVSAELMQIGYINDYNGDANRIYDGNAVARALKAEAGGGGAKTGWYSVNAHSA